MTLRQSAPRAWVSLGVPGTPLQDQGTYVSYGHARLPRVPDVVHKGDGLGWLRDLPALGTGMEPQEYVVRTTPLSSEGVGSLLRAAGLPSQFTSLPADLQALVSEPGLHQRLFSATDCYFDAGEHLAPVPGGHLLHLVSDSQWACHWLAFIGEDGSSGVVCTSAALGYAADEDDPLPEEPTQPIWVADSMAEFIWRWWADNYAFAAAHPDLCPRLQAPDWFDLAAYTAGYFDDRN